jgi:uncharacterized membrane protein
MLQEGFKATRQRDNETTRQREERTMEKIQHSVEVDVPVSAAYNQWTQFEDFPRFMEGVESVTQIDDSTTHWVAQVGGIRREWDAKIVRQEPDRVIAWDGFGGPDNAGMVEFQAIGNDRTRQTVTVDWEPQSALESVGDALGIVSRRVEKDLDRFKEFIESREIPTGAWRGRIEGGQVESGGSGSPATG